MPEQHPKFEINDAIAFEENIKAFIAAAKELDAPLAEALATVLMDIGNGEEVEQETLLNTLYQATSNECA
jgi:hypothetical protein